MGDQITKEAFAWEGNGKPVLLLTCLENWGLSPLVANSMPLSITAMRLPSNCCELHVLYL